MNNPILKLGIALVVVVGTGWFGFKTYQAKTTEYEHKLDLERIRREYIERAPVARVLNDSARYRYEAQQVFKWYFNELTTHYARFGVFKNYERFETELAERKNSRKITEHEIAQYQVRYKATQAFWNLLKSGKYDPLFSAGEKGLHLDIYDVQSVEDTKEPRLRFMFALYGTQRRWNTDSNAGVKVNHLTVNAAFHELVFSGLSAEGKLIREIRASGDPFKIDNAERFIEEFPPDVVFGYYEIPKIPYEVASAEMVFDISTRSVLTGEEIADKFTWKIPVAPEWKLPPGVSWEGAKEQEREPEEIAPAKRR